MSLDGVNFVPLKTEAKSGAWLGSSGYNNVIFYINAQGATTSATRGKRRRPLRMTPKAVNKRRRLAHLRRMRARAVASAKSSEDKG